MSERLKKALEDIAKASEQILRGNKGGGYYLCYALTHLVHEIDEIKKLITTPISQTKETTDEQHHQSSSAS